MDSAIVWKSPDTIEGVSESGSRVDNSGIPDAVWHPG
jgi:hypothetical protein